MAVPSQNRKQPVRVVMSFVLVAVGILLVGFSVFQISFGSENLWTKEDSAAYDRVTLEYHRSAYQSADQAGRTEEEMKKYRENLRNQFEKMRRKLEEARSPRSLWTSYTFWTGAICCFVGILLPFSSTTTKR